MAVACLLVASLAAQPAGEGIREATRSLLQQEHPYDPELRKQALAEAARDPEVVQLAAVIVNENRLESLLDQLLRASRLAAEAEKPSLATGATTRRTLAGRSAAIGPQAFRDLLADDARFKTDEAITPTWTLLDLGL